MWVMKDSPSTDSIDSKIIPLKSISTNTLTVSQLCCKVCKINAFELMCHHVLSYFSLSALTLLDLLQEGQPVL